jgi:hypothetical protein
MISTDTSSTNIQRLKDIHRSLRYPKVRGQEVARYLQLVTYSEACINLKFDILELAHNIYREALGGKFYV